MKKMLLLLITVACLIRSSAQNRDVIGTVTDETGKPLAGATVTIKGTNITATTDDKGNFHLNTGNTLKPVLTISFVGYDNYEYSYKGSGNATIALHQDARTLGDVIVIGYGVQRKRDVTGATAEVK